MFGNRLLPNIAPSLLLFLPPPPDLFPLPPPPPSTSRVPAWAKRGCAHCWCQRPPTAPHHRRLRSPRHCLSTVPTSAAPPLVEGCGRTTSATSPTADDLSRPLSNATSPPTTTAPRHITWQKRPLSHATSQRPREGGGKMGVGKGRRRGKEKKEENRRWGGGRLCPLPPAASFQKPARQCASHTPSRLAFQTQTRWCASHMPSRLASQMRTSGVQPTHRSIQAFLSPPPSRFGGMVSSNGKNEAAWNPHAASFE